MKVKVGLYHFCHKRNMWSVYQYTTVTEKGSTARHIKDYGYFEDAVKAVYKLNGWGEPKNITKRF